MKTSATICTACGKPCLEIVDGIAIHSRTQSGLIATYHTVLTLEELRSLQRQLRFTERLLKQFKYHLSRIMLAKWDHRYSFDHEMQEAGKLFVSVAECEQIVLEGV